MSVHREQRGVTVTTLKRLKREGEKIACLTAYDASFAAVLDRSGVDVILVGDSLGMVIQGFDTTVPVTVDDVIYHARAVARGSRRAFRVADMPFMSYTNHTQALSNAARLMQEGRAQMVKLEGGETQAGIVRELSAHGIPVCAHLGLQPQAVHKLGGYHVQGKEAAAAAKMREAAAAVEAAGAELLLLECVPAALAAEISATARIPVIGIGAGNECDGQILVLHDLLGVSVDRTPRFTRNFLTGAHGIADAVSQYVRAVKDKTFPAAEHSF
ncbi:MAG: 3-methyl-2-oxobutanoate hydroxymethyltransferase [Gammaproteobacteria bacterium]|nr:3-methyl-2-oxobutanoate hydroxymethyltransferase [Gammaproteobacteria bacterium]